MAFIDSYVREWLEGSRRPEDFVIFQSSFDDMKKYLNTLPNEPADQKITDCAKTALKEIKDSGFCAISSLEKSGFEMKTINRLFYDLDVIIL